MATILFLTILLDILGVAGAYMIKSANPPIIGTALIVSWGVVGLIFLVSIIAKISVFYISRPRARLF